ncbi:hypothetical protein VKT23_016502 [Stygiomarasmius scandens]|uniref:BAG domain-containing protein n=1 Tax=Marasmiellus scandens TaxID=2682957 RepID=A0ABR1IV05_9AGAR
MFGYRNPYSAYPSSYYPSDAYSYGYPPYPGYGYGPSPYQQAQAEQERRARLLALERERELERQREAELQRRASRARRASQYLPETFMSRGGRYVPERASKYLPDEYALDDRYDDDVDMDSYDYGLGRAGYHPQASQRGRRTSNIATRPQHDSKADTHRRPSEVHSQPSHSVPIRTRSRSRPAQNTADHSDPIHTPTPSRSHQSETTRLSSKNPVPESPSPDKSPKVPRYTYDAPPERLNEAATVIQNAFRIHRAFKTIQSLQEKFEQLKKSFVPPPKLDYQIGDDHERVVAVPSALDSISPSEIYASLQAQGVDLDAIRRVSEPRLGYTHNNAPLHAYTEALNRLLTSLDGVESFGEKKVREKRKAVVRNVEQEAGRIERLWKTLWREWTGLLLSSHSETVSQSPGQSVSQLDEQVIPKVSLADANDQSMEPMAGAEKEKDLEDATSKEDKISNTSDKDEVGCEPIEDDKMDYVVI